ncbi:MAG TPA: hypothetical protein VGK93_08250 [Candidatus Eisenbacteria bacterium]|jgi:hypothetical protein
MARTGPRVKCVALKTFSRGREDRFEPDGRIVSSPLEAARPGDVLWLPLVHAGTLELSGHIARLNPGDKIFIDGVEAVEAK